MVIDRFAFDVELLCVATRFGLRVRGGPGDLAQLAGSTVSLVTAPPAMLIETCAVRWRFRRGGYNPGVDASGDRTLGAADRGGRSSRRWSRPFATERAGLLPDRPRRGLARAGAGSARRPRAGPAAAGRAGRLRAGGLRPGPLGLRHAARARSETDRRAARRSTPTPTTGSRPTPRSCANASWRSTACSRGTLDMLLVPVRALLHPLPTTEEWQSWTRVIRRGDELPPDRFVLRGDGSGLPPGGHRQRAGRGLASRRDRRHLPADRRRAGAHRAVRRHRRLAASLRHRQPALDRSARRGRASGRPCENPPTDEALRTAGRPSGRGDPGRP